MMEATMTGKKTSTYRDYWQSIGGERLYTLARWIVFVLLFAVNLPLKSPVWPPSLESGPVVLILWAYAVYSLVMSIILFVPPARGLLAYTYIGDILFIAALSSFYEQDAIMLLPFFFVPLLSSAVRQKPMASFLIGMITAILYLAAVFVRTGNLTDVLNLSLTLQALLLMVAPWLTSSLVEQWSASNRRTIAEAEERVLQAQNQTRAYREKMYAFYQVVATLANTLDHREVLSTALHEIQKLVPYTTGMVLLSSGRPKELFVAAIEPANPGDVDRKFNINEGAIGAMLRSSSMAHIVEPINQEPETETLISLRSCTAACLVPLRIKLNTYGLLLIASEQPGAFHQEDLDLLNSMANSMIVALHSAQQSYDLKQGQGKLLAAEKSVRDRLASKLHDGPTQKIAQIMMQVDFIKQVGKNDPSMLPQELDKFAALAKAANGEMRETLFELRPLTLETQGLRAAVGEYIEKLKIRSGDTKIGLKARGAVDDTLPKEAESVLFDIIQESVNNALKHAKATNIWIELEARQDRFVTTVRDDGKGFDLSAAQESAEKRASFGLKNFGERAQIVDGTVEINSAPGKGTAISIIVPLKPAS